jgi:ferredoxin-NADP reductase
LVPGALELEVQRINHEADRVVSVVLARKDGSDLPEFDCGAHIDVILTPDLVRQYSLCGDPGAREEWTIAVLREESGRGGSEYVHSALKPGTVVGVASLRNNFPLVEAERYLFIAGGIGITPLLPMVRRLEARGKDWTMLYGGRRRASMAFLGELRHFGSRVVVAPEDECGLLDLESAIGPSPADTAVYCCGPEPLIGAVERLCAGLGRPAPHVERFAARREPATSGDQDNCAFELVLSESGRQVTIPADKTIIEVLEEEGVFVPTSCTEGFCGTCETEVVTGIPDHRDDYLTQEQRAANNRMMICVGRSKSPVLVIKR